MQGLLRTGVASLEKRYQMTLSPSSPLVRWCVWHCGWSFTRYTILEDGLTPLKKLQGLECGGAIAELGQTVLFHVQGLNQMLGYLDGQDVVDR